MKKSFVVVLTTGIVIVVFLCVLFCGCSPSTYSPPIYSAPIDVSDRTLDQFAGDHRNLILRHLASSAYWQLKEDYFGTPKAIRRQHICGVLQMSFNQVYASGPEPDAPRSEIILILRSYQPGIYGKKERITATTAGVASMSLQLRRFESEYMSELVVSGEDLFLYIFEGSPQKGRLLTQSALSMVNQELAIILAYEQELSERGYVQEAVPEASVIQSETPILNITDEACCDSESCKESCAWDGHCQVNAYINPGEPGYVYVKVFDVQTNEQLCAEDIHNSSMEYTGWSNNLLDKFFYDANITICTGNLTKQPGRFELWFHPDDGEAEQKLLEVTRTISSWIR